MTTLQNLESALAGESMAHIKYRYFAKIAREEGFEDVAKHFEHTADQEIKHAWGHLELLIGKPSTKECLQKAIDGETYEYTEMYPRMEEEAEREREEYEVRCTDWYPVEVNPHYVGFYETKEEGTWPFYKMAHWNGKKWTIDGKKPKDKIAAWRGLNEDPAILTDENASDMLENMMKDAGYERV